MIASSHIFDIDFLDVVALKEYRSGQKNSIAIYGR